MKKLAFFGMFVGLAATAFGGEEKPLASRITSLGLFKNGLAAVLRTAEVEGPGVYCLANVPDPIHGTFWVESDAPVSCRTTFRTAETPLAGIPSGSFQEGLAGRQVEIRFADPGLAPVEGTVLEFSSRDPASAGGASAWYPPYSPYYYSTPTTPGYRSAGGGFLVLETSQGTCYVDPARIAVLQVKGKASAVKQWKPMLLLTVGDTNHKPATVVISYLAKGLAWAPSYRLDRTDPKRLTLRQSAVIKNEMEPVEDARIALISGYPNIKYAHVLSPLSPRMSWDWFFYTLGQGSNMPRGVVAQQVAAPNLPETVGASDPLAMLWDQDADLHFQDIGKQTLNKGDALALETASGNADYESIALWTVGGDTGSNQPDAQPGSGIPMSPIYPTPSAVVFPRGTTPPPSQIAYPVVSYNEIPSIGSVSGKGEEVAWDVVRFRNPLKFPMTTAPVMIVADGKFLGQSISPWANPGEEVTVRVGKALSLRVQGMEQEVKGSQKPAIIAGKSVAQSDREGNLRACNLRSEPVTLVIQCPYSGELVSAEGDPKNTLLRDDLGSPNKRNQLTWSLTLKPGEEVKRTYRYRHTLAVGTIAGPPSWFPTPATFTPSTSPPVPTYTAPQEK